MNKLIFIFLFTLSHLLADQSQYDSYYKLYKQKEYKSAFVGFKELATKENDNDAAYILAYMYEHGEGCSVDKDKALKWYSLAAKQHYEDDKSRVDKELVLTNDKLYSSLSPVQNQDTKDTIHQYLYSIFNVKAHKTNYLIPLSARVNGSYGEVGDRYTSGNEVEFQFSVKYDFFPNLLGLDEVYSLAYTQHSFWQFYVGDAYFRASDYNPEFFVTVPTKTEYFKAVRFSLAHMSNGLGLPDERAWNYMTLAAYFQYKSIFTEVQGWYRFDDNFDYNPQLSDTLGYGHIKFILPYKKHLMTVLLRNNFEGKGAIDTSYSYPLFGKSFFLYLKAFAGYGETMSSFAGSPEVANTNHYDDYVEKIGIGFSISR